MRLNLPRVDGSAVPSVRSPILMSGGDLVYHRASPRLGEHTGEILEELGYGRAGIEQLARAAVVVLQ
jgi:crotonobetainyl-CoA:carnitine CoA-transferase CaiB-like acyl-CoA transferase